MTDQNDSSLDLDAIEERARDLSGKFDHPCSPMATTVVKLIERIREQDKRIEDVEFERSERLRELTEDYQDEKRLRAKYQGMLDEVYGEDW